MTIKATKLAMAYTFKSTILFFFDESHSRVLLRNIPCKLKEKISNVGRSQIMRE